MITILKKNKFGLIGALLGLPLGYLYFHFFGCNGSCAITSNPWKSMFFGALWLGLLTSFLDSKPKK